MKKYANQLIYSSELNWTVIPFFSYKLKQKKNKQYQYCLLSTFNLIILKIESIYEETQLEFEQRMGLIREYKTISNSNFSILSKH